MIGFITKSCGDHNLNRRIHSLRNLQNYFSITLEILPIMCPKPNIKNSIICILQATNQNMIGHSMMPGVQIVNVRPPTPTAQGQPKTVATVSPRVVISNPPRPTNSGVIK